LGAKVCDDIWIAMEPMQKHSPNPKVHNKEKGLNNMEHFCHPYVYGFQIIVLVGFTIEQIGYP
jgi:hypothetical protein